MHVRVPTPDSLHTQPQLERQMDTLVRECTPKYMQRPSQSAHGMMDSCTRWHGKLMPIGNRRSWSAVSGWQPHLKAVGASRAAVTNFFRGE